MTLQPFWVGISFWLVWLGSLIWFAPGWWRMRWPGRVLFFLIYLVIANAAEYWGF